MAKTQGLRKSQVDAVKHTNRVIKQAQRAVDRANSRATTSVVRQAVLVAMLMFDCPVCEMSNVQEGLSAKVGDIVYCEKCRKSFPVSELTAYQNGQKQLVTIETAAPEVLCNIRRRAS